MRNAIHTILATLVLCTAAHAAAGQTTADFNLPAQPLADSLRAVAGQTNSNILFDRNLVQGLSAKPLKAQLSVAQALQALLKGTGLTYRNSDDKTIMIVSERTNAQTSLSRGEAVAVNLARADQAMQKVEGEANKNSSNGTEEGRDASSTSDTKSEDSESKGVPEILVKGKRSLNADIERTEEAAQPYVVFGKEEIQRSQAVNLDEFLRTRLPMNTTAKSWSQTPGGSIPRSSINLRGLGENQTLILVDGRRVPGVSLGGVGDAAQPDLNGIPLAAIERIEVLPSTAGGIYGGSATGGVVNVVLRHDFQGLEVKATFANTFDTDTANRRIDVNAGFSLESGRTQVMIMATRAEANNLLIGDRDFAARSIARQRKNNPADIAALVTPPLGATVNIRGVGGALLQLKPEYGGTALGKAFTYIPLGYAGPTSDGGAALVANAGQYNLDLPDGVSGLGRGLVAAPATESASLNVRREFGTRLEAFLDLSTFGSGGNSVIASGVTDYMELVTLPAAAPNNPFQQAIAVRFPTPSMSFENIGEATTVHATGGFIAHLPHSWMGELSYGWGRSRFWGVNTGSVIDSVGVCVLSRGVAANVIPGGAGALSSPCAAGDSRPALNILQEGNTFPIDYTPYLLPSPNIFNGPYDTALKNATVRLSGPVMDLSGGPLSLSALIERREQVIEDAFLQDIDTTTRQPSYLFAPHRSQDVNSYYLEARMPFISQSNAWHAAHELELQASIRHDEYGTRSASVFTNIRVPSHDGPFPLFNYTTGQQSSTDYTLGVRYMPSEDLALRASFGTGFLPPSVAQIAPRQAYVASLTGLDPKRGNTAAYVGIPILQIQGGTPDLKPERSESWSTGIILTPRFAAGFRLSIDYTRIEKVDEIQTPANQFLLDNEDTLPGRIVRGPNLAGDPAGWAGPISSFNVTLINIANTSVEACDVQVDYTVETARFGEFHGYAVATRQSHYRNQLQPEAPVVDRVGFMDGPLEWRGNFGVDWVRGRLALSWNAQYYDSYLVYTALPLPLTPAQITARANTVLNQGSAWVPKQLYHDLIASYRFDAAPSLVGKLLANSDISFGIQNVFDKYPPVWASTNPTNGGYSTYGDPRLRRYSISFRKAL